MKLVGLCPFFNKSCHLPRIAKEKTKLPYLFPYLVVPVVEYIVPFIIWISCNPEVYRKNSPMMRRLICIKTRQKFNKHISY